MDREQLKEKMVNDFEKTKCCVIALNEENTYQLFCCLDNENGFWDRHIKLEIIKLEIDSRQPIELGIIKEQCKVDKEMFLEKIDEILDKYERMIEERNAEEEPYR